MKLERVVGKIEKLESFTLERFFELDELPCETKNLERTVKELSNLKLSNCTFQKYGMREVGEF